ncbi:MAG: hypothetical protein ACREV8_12470, partial [Gammaproteobacteria bacterium]
VMLHAFEQRLMRNPARYDDFTLSALVEYAPASDAEAAAISTLLERLWDAGPGKPASELESSLLKFATHAAGALDRVVALAVAVAAGDPDARRYLMDEIVEDGGDPTLQRQLLDWVAETGDREIKGELLKKLADSVYLGEAPNPTLFEPILGIAGSELETQADKLMVAAQESEAFAAALARVVERTAPEQAGLLKVFAARIAAGIEPQRAAGEALEIYKSR